MALVVAIEGVDGAGKQTQTALLKDYLTEEFYGKNRVKSVAFPRYEGPCGELISKLLKTQMYGFGNIEQAQLLQSVMLADRLDATSAFDDLDVVLCDRYYMSGIVYGLSDELPEPWLYKMHHTLPVANVQILIDVDPLKAKERRAVPRDNYEKNLKKQQFIRAKYLEIWQQNIEKEPHVWATINGDNTQEIIHEQIKQAYIRYINHVVFKETSYAAQ